LDITLQFGGVDRKNVKVVSLVLVELLSHDFIRVDECDFHFAARELF